MLKYVFMTKYYKIKYDGSYTYNRELFETNLSLVRIDFGPQIRKYIILV